jgi:hypothetical protein
MNGEPTDPRLETLIALLYNELPEDEARDLRRRIGADATLREEWEALVATRADLQQWEVEAPSPGFVFVQESASPRAGLRSSPAGSLPWWRRLCGAAFTGSWGVAAAGLAVALLAVSNFRIERIDSGLAFRVGRTAALPANVAQRSGPAAASNAAPAYITQDEFRAYMAGMTRTLAALLNDYGDQTDREMTQYMQTALNDMARTHSQAYDDLLNRIQTVGIGLAREQYQTNTRIDLLMTQGGRNPSPPVGQAPAGETEGAHQ